MKRVSRLSLTAVAVLWLAAATLAQLPPREIELKFEPAKTTINFTLGDVLHTVRGSLT